MKRRYESDVCIVGGGISGVLLAERLAENTGLKITLVESGPAIPTDDLGQRRQRYLEYNEHPWLGDLKPDQTAEGHAYSTMCVGGEATHWEAYTPRWTPEDFTSRASDDASWPISYEEVEPFYCEAERRIGVAGAIPEQSRRLHSRPYPMDAFPLNYNLKQVSDFAAAGGLRTWVAPSARNTAAYAGRPACCRFDTCFVCPIGAKYSPDYSMRALVATGRVEQVTEVLVRKLTVRQSGSEIEEALGVNWTTGNEVRFRARVFVLAAGYVWTSQLLLLSANSRFQNGLANSSGLVGKYVTGHPQARALIRVPMRLYPGIHQATVLYSNEFMRRPRNGTTRHDLTLRVVAARPLLLRQGMPLFGDALLKDWRERNSDGLVGAGSYFEVPTEKHCTVTLSTTRKNRWGDALPVVRTPWRKQPDTLSRLADAWRQTLAQLTAKGASVVRSAAFEDDAFHHLGGGCRMGTDPAVSVCDSSGRTHGHENLYIAGAPCMVTGGTTNSTLTFVALALRTAATLEEKLAKK